jgi:putative membrane protein
MQDTFGFERNHYDRVVHFLFGFLLGYPLSEIVLRQAEITGVKRFFVAFAIALSLSSGYEILEWIVAEIVDPEAAYAYLGTQGDLFDAQKDMGIAAIGAAIGLTAMSLIERRIAARRRH